MSRDGISEERSNGDSESENLAQRITALEEQNAELCEENERIRTRLDKQQHGWLPDLSRRETLAGLLGGGALLSGMGTASADPGNGHGGPPFAAKDEDHSGDYLGEGTPVDRIDVDQLHITGSGSSFDDMTPYRTEGVTETGSYRIKNRKLYSTEHQVFYVNPDDGSDDNDGSESAPFRTLQRASEELALFQLHAFTIVLAKENPDTKYDSAHFPPSVLGYDGQYVEGSTHGKMFHIIGDRSNPSAYPFEREHKLGIGFAWNTDVPNATITGVELGGLNLDGMCTCIGCNFTGWAKNGVAVAGYTGRGEFRGCTFTSEATYAFSPEDQKILSARDSTINCDYVISGATYDRVNMGGFLFLDEDPGVPFFEDQDAINQSNIYVQVDGPVFNGPGTLLEGDDDTSHNGNIGNTS